VEINVNQNAKLEFNSVKLVLILTNTYVLLVIMTINKILECVNQKCLNNVITTVKNVTSVLQLVFLAKTDLSHIQNLDIVSEVVQIWKVVQPVVGTVSIVQNVWKDMTHQEDNVIQRLVQIVLINFVLTAQEPLATNVIVDLS